MPTVGFAVQPVGVGALIFSKPGIPGDERLHFGRPLCAESSGIDLVCVRVRFLDNEASDPKKRCLYRHLPSCFVRNTMVNGDENNDSFDRRLSFPETERARKRDQCHSIQRKNVD